MIISEAEIKNIITQAIKPTDIELVYKIELAADRISTEIITRELDEVLNKMEERKMGYQPNVVSKGDVVIINGVRFRVKDDFVLAHGDKNLLLKLEKNEPQTFIARTEKAVGQ